MKFLFEWAKHQEISKIVLRVDAENTRANKLYEKMGFITEGLLKKDKRLPDGSFRDIYVMALFL